MRTLVEGSVICPTDSLLWRPQEFRRSWGRMVPRMTIPWLLPPGWNRFLGWCTVSEMRGRRGQRRWVPSQGWLLWTGCKQMKRVKKIKEIKYFLSCWAIHGFFSFVNIFVLQFSHRFLFSRLYWLWAPFWVLIFPFGLDDKCFIFSDFTLSGGLYSPPVSFCSLKTGVHTKLTTPHPSNVLSAWNPS